MNDMKYPRFRCFLEDCLIPFACGFFGILLIFWLRMKLSGDEAAVLETFVDNNTGHIFMRRHGIQETEEDLHQQPDIHDLSLVALAGEGFKRVYLTTREKEEGGPSKAADGLDIVELKRSKLKQLKQENLVSPEPPGAIWSWPRIEKEAPSKPIVWVITPTFRNPHQHAELTRIAQAMYPCRRFVRWLVVDDTRWSKDHPEHIPNLKEFLSQFKVKFKVIKSKPKVKGQRLVYNPKGVAARRTAIEYIREKKLKGVIYFADDDNTYDSDIFRQMQSTKTVSVWPTGAITEWTISGPVVDENGKVVDFFDAWTANRKFPLDFASFAVNADLLHSIPTANIPWIQGYEETVFLKSLNLKKEDFLPLAANATEVLTWHTKTIRDKRPGAQLRRVLKNLSIWPKNVRELVNKYQFLFEELVTPTMEPEREPVEVESSSELEIDINYANVSLESKNKFHAQDILKVRKKKPKIIAALENKNKERTTKKDGASKQNVKKHRRVKKPNLDKKRKLQKKKTANMTS